MTERKLANESRQSSDEQKPGDPASPRKPDGSVPFATSRSVVRLRLCAATLRATGR
jgi:hypothetical protein